jgi:hypothetical protein
MSLPFALGVSSSRACRARVVLAVAAAGLVALAGGAAGAQTAGPNAPAPASAPVTPVGAAAPAPAAPVGAPPAAMPEPAETTGAVAPSALDVAPVAGTLVDAPTRSPNVSYGVGARLRWVSVPKWMLNLFTTRNVPLSSYAVAGELYRRKGEFDFIVSIGYQNMSPSDGNWLGRGHDPTIDTDYVQFKSLALWAADASFVWHSFFNDWFGLHYGAGLGLAIVTGQMLRTSDGSAGCATNAGDFTKCYPVGLKGGPCPPSGCSDTALAMTQGTGADSSTTPHRFVDPNVPSALPIVNVLVGMDFRVPRVRGWEAKIEGGFYDAFFLGGGVGYTF